MISNEYMRVNRNNKDERDINMNKKKNFLPKRWIANENKKQNDCNDNKFMLESEPVSKKEEYKNEFKQKEKCNS